MISELDRDCPHTIEWPEEGKRFLWLLLLTDALTTKLNAPAEEQWQWLLIKAIRGRYYEGRVVTYSAPAAVCYPEFVKLLERWKVAGSPTDFKAIARLRGAR